MSSIYYSLGYAKTRLSEARQHDDPALLQDAERFFSQVAPGTSNYYKAQRAQAKISALSNSIKKSGSNAGLKLITAAAFMVFVFTQFSFFIGNPVFGYQSFRVNEVALDKVIADYKIDTKKYENKIAELKTGSYLDSQKILLSVSDISQKKPADAAKIDGLIETRGKLDLQGFKKISEATYGLITFGAMIFAIAGLFLREITRLRFGVVELEKASIDQVSISTSLNIGR